MPPFKTKNKGSKIMKITNIREIEHIVKVLNKAKKLKKDFKILRVGRAKWVNALTLEMQTTDNIFVLGFPSSCRPLLLNYFNVVMPDGKTEEYFLTTGYTHANICDDCLEAFYGRT